MQTEAILDTDVGTKVYEEHLIDPSRRFTSEEEEVNGLTAIDGNPMLPQGEYLTESSTTREEMGPIQDRMRGCVYENDSYYE